MGSGSELESSLYSRELDLARTILDSDDSTGKSLKTPLYLALSVSPLYLLMPVQLLKSRVGGKFLLDVIYSLYPK
jgi:hypothetical protein